MNVFFFLLNRDCRVIIKLIEEIDKLLRLIVFSCVFFTFSNNGNLSRKHLSWCNIRFCFSSVIDQNVPSDTSSVTTDPSRRRCVIYVCQEIPPVLGQVVGKVLCGFSLSNVTFKIVVKLILFHMPLFRNEHFYKA